MLYLSLCKGLFVLFVAKHVHRATDTKKSKKQKTCIYFNVNLGSLELNYSFHIDLKINQNIQNMKMQYPLLYVTVKLNKRNPITIFFNLKFNLKERTFFYFWKSICLSDIIRKYYFAISYKLTTK